MPTKRRQCKKCGFNRAERFYTSPRGTICSVCQRESRRQASRDARLLEVYELAPEEYRALFNFQDGKCGACGEERTYLLHVDHDHRIEKEIGVRESIRGLLCKRCNKLLRDSRDSIGLLRMLANYLENPPAKKVLK